MKNIRLQVCLDFKTYSIVQAVLQRITNLKNASQGVEYILKRYDVSKIENERAGDRLQKIIEQQDTQIRELEHEIKHIKKPKKMAQ